MPAVTRSTIQVHSFGEQLSTRITPSLPAPHHPASETLHLHDFITAAAHQQCVSRCEKYDYKSKSYIWCSSNLPQAPALEAVPKQICLCACGACTHMTSRGCHNRDLLFSELTFHRESQKRVRFGAQSNVCDINTNRRLLDFRSKAKNVWG